MNDLPIVQASGRLDGKVALLIGASRGIGAQTAKGIARSGAKVVLATAANSDAITATVDGLSPRGELVVIGADATPLGISPNHILLSGKIVRGHPSGTAQDVQDTMAFSALHGIRPMTEIMPLDRADEAPARDVQVDRPRGHLADA